MYNVSINGVDNEISTQQTYLWAIKWEYLSLLTK